MTVKDFKNLVNSIPEDEDNNILMNDCPSIFNPEYAEPVDIVTFDKFKTFTYIRVV